MRWLLIHGSAVDATTFRPLARALGPGCVAPDRRGADGARVSVEQHAADAASRIAGPPALVIGSSFGAVIALELARSRPELVAGVVAMEPPVPADPLSPAVPAGLGCAFDAAAASGDGEAAAEMFVRAVLGDAGFERIPARLRGATLKRWRWIRSDMRSLADYRFERIAGVTAPVLILRGARSPPWCDPSIAALARMLPRASRASIPGAGHMMHVEAAAAVAREIERFAVMLGRCAG